MQQHFQAHIDNLQDFCQLLVVYGIKRQDVQYFIEKFIEEMKELQEKLLSFINSKAEDNEEYITYKELKDILIEKKIQQDIQKLKSFLILILNISNNHHRSTNFFNRIEQILKFLE